MKLRKNFGEIGRMLGTLLLNEDVEGLQQGEGDLKVERGLKGRSFELKLVFRKFDLFNVSESQSDFLRNLESVKRMVIGQVLQVKEKKVKPKEQKIKKKKVEIRKK